MKCEDNPKRRVYADFHVHSKYSRATSMKMDLDSIHYYSSLKGLNLVGTGDFSHPLWMSELQKLLEEVDESNLYQLKNKTNTAVFFILTNEVSTIFECDGKIKKIHHVIFTPKFDTALQINDRLQAYGDLSSDGRPILSLSPPAFVEEVLEISRENVIIPAHVWTPWFSLFGSKSGFDRIEDCYQDMTKHIFALETGLSSDPPMNWRLSALDKYTLISNSDSHSPYPYRLGREANVFDVEELSYQRIVNAIREKDKSCFKFTIETNPAYGKYHWSGHRNCNISLPPVESKKRSGLCPVCGKPLTQGVDERIDDLADRSLGFKPKGAVEFIHLLPLHEIIGMVLDVGNLYAKSIWRVFNTLVSRFRNEYSVLLDVSQEELVQVVNERLAEVILKVRKGQIQVVPGYDGVYGKLIMSDKGMDKKRGSSKQLGLEDFMRPTSK